MMRKVYQINANENNNKYTPYVFNSIDTFKYTRLYHLRLPHT